jgi:hypothetical protein
MPTVTNKAILLIDQENGTAFIGQPFLEGDRVIAALLKSTIPGCDLDRIDAEVDKFAAG